MLWFEQKDKKKSGYFNHQHLFLSIKCTLVFSFFLIQKYQKKMIQNSLTMKKKKIQQITISSYVFSIYPFLFVLYIYKFICLLNWCD